MPYKDVTSLSGSPKRNSLSKRPGRRSAGSMESSRFVAPITTTSPRLSNPSIRARSVDTIELQDGQGETGKLNYAASCRSGDSGGSTKVV